MVSEEDRMRRLAFAKYLIEMGSINADNVLPYSATALLNFHDALEFLFDLILDDNGIYDYEDKHVNIVADLALAFELLLKDFEESKRSPFGFSPYQFLKKDQISSSNLGIADIKPIKDYVDRTNENLKSLNENMKILALGIDYNKYVQFKFLIPANIYWIFGSDEPQIYVGDFEPLTKKKIEFCKNFIIETALKLQQFDFNFKID